MLHASDDFSGFRKWHQGLFEEGEGSLAIAAHADRSPLEGLGGHGLQRSAFSVTGSMLSPPRGDRDKAREHGTASAPAAPASMDALDMQACFEGDEEEKKNEGSAWEDTAGRTASTLPDPAVKPPSAGQTATTSDNDHDHSSKSLPLPELQYDHSPKDLGRASHGRERQVTLLPMEATDSGEMRASSALEDPYAPYSPSTSFTQSQEQPLDASFVAELRMFETLPAFPAEIEASLNRFERQVNSKDLADSTIQKKSRETPTAAAAVSPARSSLADVPAVAGSLMDMSEQIAAEEAELSNYLSWLESQHRSTPAPATAAVPRNPSPAPPAPSTSTSQGTGASAGSRPSASPSGIPRYSQSPAQQRHKQASQQRPHTQPHNSNNYEVS